MRNNFLLFSVQIGKQPNMRSLLILFFLLISVFSFGQYPTFVAKYTTVKFPKTKEGARLNYVYHVSNDGKSTLEIYDFEVECSCTEVNIPKRKLEPGEKMDILVTFDTNGKYFYQDREIIFHTNTRKGIDKLRFKVFVEPKPLTEEEFNASKASSNN